MFSKRSLILIVALCLSVLSAPITEDGEIVIRETHKAPANAPANAHPAANVPANVCALHKREVTVPRFQRRSLAQELVNVFRRNGEELIGWHGTNEKTANLWTQKGEIFKPLNPDGSAAGKSGLDAELGPGLYVTDNLAVAGVAAVINGQNNKVPGKVCAIFAKNKLHWRQQVLKAQIPESIRGNGAENEAIRQAYFKLLPRPGDANTVKVGPLRGVNENQLLVPESLNPTLFAKCFDVDAQGNSAAAHALNPQMSPYTSDMIMAEWEIIKAHEDLAKAAKAAITKKC